jgi:hypothetical protein
VVGIVRGANDDIPEPLAERAEHSGPKDRTVNHTISRWLACGACAVGSVAFAQEPAARLLPARAVDPTEPLVVRAAPPAPGVQFQPPVSTPAPGVHQPASPPAPVQTPPTHRPPPQGQPSLWGGVKSAFGAKPADPQQPPPAQQQPRWPAGEQQPPTPPPPPPGVYAGPPAYRWYGYGTPTAGANPYAPAGRYPQASGTWFAQTGATPGAFPVPVGGMPVTPREQPVVVQAFPQEQTRPVDVAHRPAWSRPSEWPEVMPHRAGVGAETPRPAERREVMMPVGPGMPADPTAAAPTPEVEWQPASANSRVPIASTPTPDATPRALPVPVSPPGTTPPADWSPAKPTQPADAPLPAVPSLPTVTVTRGQAPPVAKTDADVDATIRSACFGRASRVGVARPGPQRLHVTLVVPTEGDARDAAAVVSRLPELKTYAVTFEAVIGR